MVRLIAITLGDFEDAAGADGSIQRQTYRAAVRRDGLQHHRRIADRHEARAFEHMHQGQRALGTAHRNCFARGFGRNRRDQRHLVPYLEDLLDVQCRTAPEAFGPGIKGVQAMTEVPKDALNIRRLGIHGCQDKAGNDGNQKTAPSVGALTKKTICNPSHCVFRRGTLQAFSAAGSSAYPALAWEVSAAFPPLRSYSRQGREPALDLPVNIRNAWPIVLKEAPCPHAA